jgi:MFS transporter, FHS family, L-fucose permease
MENSAYRNKRGYWISVGIIAILFFIFGFITWLNGILIPYLKIACELNIQQALLVTSAFYISYFVMALPSSWVLRKTGFKNGMMLGLLIMAFGALLFIPAAIGRAFPLFLTGLFIMGTGLTILQTASNPYITIIGPIETAAKRISIMGICNKIAGAIAPLLLAFFILHDGDNFVAKLKGLDIIARNNALDELASRVIIPYVIIAISLATLAILVKFSSLPNLETEDDEKQKNEAIDNKSIFQFPHLWLGVLALFFYVGNEVIAGDTIIQFGKALNIPFSEARIFTTYTLLAMIIGYVFFGMVLIPKILSQHRALQISAVLGLMFTLLAIFSEGKNSVFFVALLGFANAIVWPAIWPLAIHNLGKHIKTASSLLIMAIVGGALLPYFWGFLAEANKLHPQTAYWICIPGYLFILLYALWGYKAGLKK